MARKVFYSFYYKPDNWRASQVRNIGVVEGNPAITDNDWETVTRGGDPAIKRWIDGQLFGKSCTIVLIGSNTAGRKWINYEIESSWNLSKGLLGIHVHRLKDRTQSQSTRGANPFADFTIRNGTMKLSSIIPVHDPPFYSSTDAYAYIAENLEDWVEEAIAIRAMY